MPKEAKGTPVVNKAAAPTPTRPCWPSHVVQAGAWTTTGPPLRPAPVHIPSDEAEEAPALHRCSIKLRSPRWADGWRTFQHGGWVNTPRAGYAPRVGGTAMSPHAEGGTVHRRGRRWFVRRRGRPRRVRWEVEA